MTDVALQCYSSLLIVALLNYQTEQSPCWKNNDILLLNTVVGTVEPKKLAITLLHLKDWINDDTIV